MVLVSAGTYIIGSDSGASVARPAHAVQLAAYGIGAREVTVGDYEEFVRSGRAVAPWGGARPDGNLPVTGVQWSEAAGYCAWRHPDAGRLPSEEEWEAAARGAQARLFPWGNRWDAGAANTAGAKRGAPTLAGNFARGNTPDGISDLIGNVWEWTSSPYKPYASGAPASGGYYVIRGGAYNTVDSLASGIFRAAAEPATSRDRLFATGFRCAMAARPGS
jgi:iron(II)-dependent oxidoreductase